MMAIQTKIKIRRRSVSAYLHYGLFLIVLFLCFHFNNVTIASIKISELSMLIAAPVMLVFGKSVNKYIVYFCLFFFFLILITIIKNFDQEFFMSDISVSILKQPYFISFTRFIEYACCLVFSVYCYKTLQCLERHHFDINKLLKLFLWINGLLAFIFLAMYGMDKLGLINAESTWYFYSGMRLRGFYKEGGPFGLMVATLFCLSTLVSKRQILLKILLAGMVLIARSKAGMLMIILWLAYSVYERLPKRGLLRPTALILGSCAVLLVGSIIADNYILILANIQQEVLQRPNDGNLVMGRISGFFISPKMVAHNPLVGVGMGNYSLVRNNPEYLGFFPPVEGWDLSGLGGLITLMAESGIIGFLGFLFLVIALHWKLSKHISKAYRNKLLLLFLLPFVLGVQLYFIYVWFSVGYVLYLMTKHTHTLTLPPVPTNPDT